MKSDSKNVRWGIVLSYASLCISLVGTLFLTNRILNLLGDYNYGLLSFANSITTWLTVVSSALIASYLRFTSIEAAENQDNVSKTNTIYFKLFSGLGIIVLLLGVSITGSLYFLHVNFGSYNWESSKLIYLFFLLSTINITINLLSTVFIQFIHYKKKFIFEKTLTIIGTVLSYIAHFVIAYFTQDIVLIAIYPVFSSVLMFFVNYWFCKHKLNIKFTGVSYSESKALVKSIFVFSSVLLLNSIVDQISHNMDKTLLGIFSTPENVTIYQMGMQFNTYLATFSVAVSSVFVPQIYDFYAKHDYNSVNKLFLKVSKLQAIVVVFIAFGFVACGYDFILWWIGPKRINSYYCGAILMVLNVMPLSIKLSIEIQRAANKHKFRSFLYLAVALLNVGFSILLLLVMPKEQAVFACLFGTVLASIICHWVAMNIYNKKIMKLPMEKHLLQLGKQVSFGVFGAALAMVLRKTLLSQDGAYLSNFLIEGGLYVLVYGGCLLLFERKFIIDILKKAH